jgi:5-methylcytosine-specific restriction endonuclease McrA
MIAPWDFRGEKVDEISFNKIFTTFAARTQILSSDHCVVCDSKSNLEMHHVKALRKEGVNLKDNYMLAMMQRINRKQICV